MNGQDPNLNNGLGGQTLGMANPNVVPNTAENPVPNPSVVPNTAVNPVPNPMPLENNSQVDSLGTMPSEPVARPIPGTEGLMPNNINDNNFTPLGNVNGFTNSSKMENIGAMPPQGEKPKKKGKIGKILFVLLIILLMCGVAFGVYYFLSISNKITVTTKTVSIGIGETVPDNVKEFVTVTKGNIDSCSVNTKNVDPNIIGEYEVTVTCGDDTYKTKIVVSDKNAPKVDLKIAFKTINSTVSVFDFVTLCIDETECSELAFADETKVNEYLTTPGGPYEVVIEAKDKYENKASYTTFLYVTASEINLFANFVSPEETLTDYKAKKTVTDVFAIGGSLEFLNVARRDYKYVFEDETAYNEVVKEKNDTITFDGTTGLAIYDDEKLTLTISNDLSLETLKSENNGAFPITYQEIQVIYKDTKGYTPIFLTKYHDESEE